MNRLHEIFSWQQQESLLFTRLDFWLFFVAVMAVFVLIHKRFLLRSIFLTGVSLFFYFKTSGNFVLLLGFMLLFNYLIGLAVHAKKGLKTGMYYLRTKAARDAIQFTVDKASLQEPIVAVSKDQREAEISCSLDNPEGCEMCGS